MLSQDRVERVLQEMQQRNLKQMLITDPVAIFWLTGKWIHPGERFLALYIRSKQKPVLFVNALFQFSEDIGVEKVYFTDTDNIIPLLQKIVDASLPLGVDKILPARFLLPMMEQHVASGFQNGSIAIDQTRACKDDTEIALMKESSRINDRCMEDFKHLVQPGITELEIADQMLEIYKKHGASGYSFDPIVAFGVNAADPHHMPDDTPLKEGDCVLFDVGGVYRNYCSDMTRTFFYKGEPSEEQRRIYQLVRRANEESTAMLQPGIVIGSVDQKARDIITEGGYGEYFTHRLGHFIGIEDHEYGDVAHTNTDIERVGIIHSIEPGIYYPPANIGVRIEDLVLITPNGHEVLNHYSHDIEIIE